MAVGIGDVMRICRNYFWHSFLDSSFSVVNGVLKYGSDNKTLEGSGYIAIQGSDSDGVYYCSNGTVKDNGTTVGSIGKFDGRIWFLNPPKDFIKLVERVSEYDTKTPISGMMSESFGGYSYTRVSGDAGHGVISWIEAYKGELQPYMRSYTEVMV